MGVETFDFIVLDLSSFSSVREFASIVSERVKAGTMPPIEVIANCAGYSSYVMDAKTGDGFDAVYQTNVLSPFLLTVLLLGTSFPKASDGVKGKVINVSSETVGFGDLAFFDSFEANEKRVLGSSLGVKDGLSRYGSSKFIMDVAMYTLRERLLSAGSKSLNIFSLDPGGLSNTTNLSRGDFPLILWIIQAILGFLRPLLRHLKKNLINDASVPAEALVKVAFDKSLNEAKNRVYFVLDDEVGLRSIGPIVKDKGEGTLERVMKDAGVSREDVAKLGK